METIKQKPWFKSFSNWLALIVIFLGAFSQAITDGVIPVEGIFATIIPALFVIFKRMSNENTVTRANAHIEAAKVSGGQPPANPS